MANIKDNFPKVSCIYKITNIITDKIYIGSAVNFSLRAREHRTTLKMNKHANQHLQRSYLKYGRDAFKFEIVELVEDRKDLITKEQYYIDTLNPYYNMQKIAGGSALGLKRTKETCEKISKALTGKPLTQEHKNKIGKTVIQFDRLGNIIKQYPSIKIASQETGVGRTNINACTKYINKTAGGFIWRYESEVTIGK